MKLKRDKTTYLLTTYFNGNYNRFARELKIDPSHLYRFITQGIGGGNKVIGAVINFCKRNGIDYEEYIDLGG